MSTEEGTSQNTTGYKTKNQNNNNKVSRFLWETLKEQHKCGALAEE